MIDTHVHCNYSWDCPHSVGEMAGAAAAKGLEMVCFTTHYEPARLALTDKRHGIRPEEVGAYMREVENAGGEHGIKTLAGLEVGYEPDCEREIGKMLAEHPFDFALGSVHLIDGVSVGNPAESAPLFRRYGGEIYGLYFDKIESMAASGLVDSVAHFDVIAKYTIITRGRDPVGEYYARAAEAAGAIKRAGIAFELNFGSRARGRLYPHESLLKEFEGVPVTYGSDSHSPGQIGGYWEDAIRILGEAGRGELSYFEQRKRKVYKIPKKV